MSSGTDSEFPYEKVIRLLQMQAFIYFPDHVPSILRHVGLFAAARALEAIEVRKTKIDPYRRGTAESYADLFDNPLYASVFDATFGNDYDSSKEKLRGFGWHRLMREKTPADFKAETARQIEKVDPIVRMIDFIFRQLDHDGNPDAAGIKRAQYFIWKDPDKKMSGKTIRTRWSEFKASSIFIYVDQAFFGGAWMPLSPTLKNYIGKSRRISRETVRIQEFIRTCEYVGQRISNVVDIPWPFQFSDGTTTYAIRPQTSKLSKSETDRMIDYKSGVADFDKS